MEQSCFANSIGKYPNNPSGQSTSKILHILHIVKYRGWTDILPWNDRLYANIVAVRASGGQADRILVFILSIFTILRWF